MSIKRQQLPHEAKIAYLTNILTSIAEDNEIFAGMLQVLQAGDGCTDSFLDVCYETLHGMITLFRHHKTTVQQSLQNKLLDWEHKIHQAEQAYELSQGNSDDILQQL